MQTRLQHFWHWFAINFPRSLWNSESVRSKEALSLYLPAIFSNYFGCKSLLFSWTFLTYVLYCSDKWRFVDKLVSFWKSVIVDDFFLVWVVYFDLLISGYFCFFLITVYLMMSFEIFEGTLRKKSLIEEVRFILII